MNQMRELKVEDALIYLDQVKMEFSSKPEIYNEFLEIMKNFKAQEIDTPGVIRRVSNLFRGYNTLILGFNTFLPEGYKIELKDIEQIERERENAANAAQQARSALAPPIRPKVMLTSGTGDRPAGPSNGSAATVGGPRSSPIPPANNTSVYPMNTTAPTRVNNAEPTTVRPPRVIQTHKFNPSTYGSAYPGVPTGVPRPSTARMTVPQQRSKLAGDLVATRAGKHPAATKSNGQPVEFDHAINYVTTIKRRFSDDPDTYKTFLEILHTYQREQRGIKTVLDQVSELFKDHPDLLKEFTYFLPDAVQDQAKERLHRAAQKAEMRKRMQAESADAAAASEATSNRRGRAKNKGGGGIVMRNRLSQSAVPSTDEAGLADSGRVKSKGPSKNRGRRTPDEHFYVRAAEREFFERIRSALVQGEGGKETWTRFMKILALYSQEVLSRADLLTLAGQLLDRHADLFLEFKKMLQSRANMPRKGKNGGSAAQPWYGMAVSDVDFSQSRRCTPSYRTLPQYFPRPPCSMRSSNDTKVLNDQWVSLPVGSEENYSFKHMRRNTFEETLFKCEDERFEMDMVIDSNSSTIKVLEPLASEIEALRAAEGEGSEVGNQQQVFQYKLDPRTLSRVHMNSITRIYGEHGVEILELLRKNPAGAIPVVLNRLKQKDIEWRRARQELARQWMSLMEANFHKSLDHRSFYFRTQDKRAISIRNLTQDLIDAHAQRISGSAPSKEVKTAEKEAPADPEAPKTGETPTVNDDNTEPTTVTVGNKAKSARVAFADTSAAAAAAAAAQTTRKDKQQPPFTIGFAGGDPDLWIPYGVENSGGWFCDRDAYQLVSYATECGNWSKTDKLLMHNLWRDFLGPMLKLPSDWFHRAASALSHSLPPNAVLTGRTGVLKRNEVVTTPYGQGKIKTYRPGASAAAEKKNQDASGETMDIEVNPKDELSAFYEVHLTHGATVFVRPVAVSTLTPESTAPTEFPTFKDDGDEARVAPHQKHQVSEDEKPLSPRDHLFIGTQAHYGFFRLYALLQARLGVARELAKAAKERKAASEGELVADGSETKVSESSLHGKDSSNLPSFPTVVSATYALLNGVLDTTTFEETCRYLLGNGSYVLYTIDKLVSHVIRHLHAMATEGASLKCVELWRYCAARGFTPLQYVRAAQDLFTSRDEALFKMHIATKPVEDLRETSASSSELGNQQTFLSQPPAVLAIEYLGTAEEVVQTWEKRMSWLQAYVAKVLAEKRKATAASQPTPATQEASAFASSSGTRPEISTALATKEAGPDSTSATSSREEIPPVALGEPAPAPKETYRSTNLFAKGPSVTETSLPRVSRAILPSNMQDPTDSAATSEKPAAVPAPTYPGAGTRPRLELDLGLSLGLGLDKKRSRDEKDAEEVPEKRPKPST